MAWQAPTTGLRRIKKRKLLWYGDKGISRELLQILVEEKRRQGRPIEKCLYNITDGTRLPVTISWAQPRTGLGQRPSKIRRITRPESVTRDRRATYVLPCTALLTLRAAHAKYGETRCTISSCLALGPIYRRIYIQFCNSL